MSLHRKLRVVFLGYVFAQAILLIASPVISRLYTATDIGTFGYIAAFCAAVLPLGSLRYEYTLPLLKHLKTRYVMVRSCSLISVFVSMVLVGIYILYTGAIGDNPLSVKSIVFIWILLSTQFLIQIRNCFLIGIGDVSQLTIGKILQNTVFVCVQILLPLLVLADSTLLLLSLLISQLVNLVYLLRVSEGILGHVKLSTIQYRHIRRLLLKRYIRFPLFTSWSSLLNSLTTMLPVLCIGGLFGPVNLGLYYFTYRIIAAPLGLITQTVSQVFLKEFADKVIYHRPIKKNFFTVSLALLLLSLFYVLTCRLLSNFDTVIFGENWRGVGDVIRYMSLPMGMMLIASPLSSLLNTLGKNHVLSIWQSLFFVCTVYVIGFMRYESFNDFLWVLSMSWSGLYLLYWLVIMSAVLFYEKNTAMRVTL